MLGVKQWRKYYWNGIKMLPLNSREVLIIVKEHCPAEITKFRSPHFHEISANDTKQTWIKRLYTVNRAQQKPQFGDQVQTRFFKRWIALSTG